MPPFRITPGTSSLFLLVALALVACAEPDGVGGERTSQKQTSIEPR